MEKSSIDQEKKIIIGAAGTFSNLALSILLIFSASFVRHVNVKISKGEPEKTLQVRF